MAKLVKVYNLNVPDINENNNLKNEALPIPLSDLSNGFTNKVSHEKDFPDDQQVKVTWKDIRYEVTTKRFFRKEKTSILKNVSGCAPAGMLTGVLGPSGAGKTTLLNILSGFKLNKFKGLVLVNGEIPSMDFYRQRSSYTPQDMYLFPHLTVRETMTVAASLKLPRSTSENEKKKKILAVLEQLSLVDIQNTKTNELSGGEKKRMFIAQELINNPPLMLFDEPTSGLDSSLSQQIIHILADLAKQGRTIICTIHQPSSSAFEYFQNLNILSKGECIYNGLRSDFANYLNSCGLVCPQYHNPADFAIDIASDVLPGKSRLLQKQSEEKEKYLIVKDEHTKKYPDIEFNDSRKESLFIFSDSTFSTMKAKSHRYSTSYFAQFLILLKRIFFSTARQPMLAIVCMISLSVLAALIGIVYRNIGSSADMVTANIGLLALTVIILTFVAIMPTLLNFPTERSGVVREYHNGWYSIGTYFLAKTIAEIPVNFVFPVAFVTAVYWLTDQPSDLWRYFYFLLFSILLTLNAQSIPIIIGALFSPKVTVFLVPVICLPLLLFCNFFLILNPLPSYINWIAQISPFSLSYSGMIMTLYGFERETLTCSLFCVLQNPKFILKILNISDSGIYMNIGILCGSLVFLRVVGFLCLYLSIRRFR